MKLDTLDHIPEEILPRYGNIKKKLNIEENNSYYILTAKKCRKQIKIPKIIKLTNQDLMAIGLYLAEGKKEKPHKNKKSNHNGEINFSNSNLISLNLICELLEKFKIKREELRTRLFLNINYKNKLNEKYFSKYWMKNLRLNPNMKRNIWLVYKGVRGGRLSKNTSPKGCIELSYASVIFINIFVPFTENFFKQAIFENNKLAMSLILKGYFAGDGHVNYSNNSFWNWKRKQVEFLCNDSKLRNLLKEALYLLGLNDIKETNPLKTKTHSYALRIYNKHDFLILRKYKILNLIDYKRETFRGLLNQYKNLNFKDERF